MTTTPHSTGSYRHASHRSRRRRRGALDGHRMQFRPRQCDDRDAPVASAEATSPVAAATTPAPANSNANIPGFSGPADPATDTKPGHMFGRCLNSWFTTTSKALKVHVEYPGPALINVSVMFTGGADVPPDTNQSFTMPKGQQAKDLAFSSMSHVDYVQINPVSDRGSLTCDAAKR